MECKKCVVCNNTIDEKEVKEQNLEFQAVPAHKECFEAFDNAGQVLDFVKGFIW